MYILIKDTFLIKKNGFINTKNKMILRLTLFVTQSTLLSEIKSPSLNKYEFASGSFGRFGRFL